MSDLTKAVFLSYASTAFAQALWRVKQDAEAPHLRSYGTSARQAMEVWG